MPMAKRDIRDCLMRKFGFEAVAGSLHDAVALKVGGKKVATVRFSRAHSQIDDTILTLMAREARVNRAQLRKMCECTISAEQYLTLMRRRGFLD